ncbi:AMP-dependent synthetase and ligase [Alcanivorax balearicus MACL04]|uniref:AMP-dependent synthetase and ligase n=1 Tax=Alloalcanivorax balearicus MACL04 TaxID=1177182 RepID=A0ABT2QW05_9GAMM|nr:long-chain-fatty-acid--CoA ligase [Alloalcanivorax balearicus]MCU5781704.1 AMP-dependent synthetase and ligase [Alloalcanivorax balearicus MACL04]
MNITQGLRRAQQINRNGIAIIEGDLTRTWAEVGDRVARLAGAFGEYGVKPGDRVAVLMLNSARYLELYLACAWSGAVIVPLNIRWSTRENALALEDCGARLLFVDAAFEPSARELADDGMATTVVWADDGASPTGLLDYETLLNEAAPVADVMCDQNDLAGIFYTGGTTGRSKGVMLSHGNLVANAFNALAEGLFPRGSVYLHAAPMFHLANGAAMYSQLLCGGTNVIIQAFSPEALTAAVERHGVTDMLLVPTMIQMLVDSEAVVSADLSSVRRVLYGASPISEAVLDRALARLPDAGFVQLYGMTELSPIATLNPPENHLGEARERGLHKSAGRATLGVEVRIVGDDNNQLPPGQVGEIVARGDNLMQGYWNRPEETGKAIVDGWMHTGDGGYLDADGYLFVVDRVKDMIISGGENVYSVEVENTIAEHPAVAQCAVIGIPDDHWGEAVHAVVLPKPGEAIDGDELIAFCKARIAGYKCPRSVEVRDQPLPMSGAGKILKTELRRPWWETREHGIS